MQNKKLFEMYVKELVKNVIREELKTMLPEMIGEYNSNRPLTESTDQKKTALDRAGIVNIMKQHFTQDGDTIRETRHSPMESMVPPNANVPDFVAKALTRDYSELMKTMANKDR
jgi:hypothetical protein